MRRRMFPQWWCQLKKALDLLSQLFCNAPLFRGKGWVRIGHYFENGQSNRECEIGTELGDTCEPLRNPLLFATLPKPRVPLFQRSLLSAKSHEQIINSREPSDVTIPARYLDLEQTSGIPVVRAWVGRRTFALAPWSEHWAYPFVPEEMHRVM